MQISVDYSNSEYASAIKWLSDDYKIQNMVPYISAIISDGGEEYEELYGDDFKVVSLNDFKALPGEEEDVFILCYKATIDIDIEKLQNFKAALEYSSNQVEVKFDFKTQEGNEIEDEIFEGFYNFPIEIKVIG